MSMSELLLLPSPDDISRFGPAVCADKIESHAKAFERMRCAFFRKAVRSGDSPDAGANSLTAGFQDLDGLTDREFILLVQRDDILSVVILDTPEIR